MRLGLQLDASDSKARQPNRLAPSSHRRAYLTALPSSDPHPPTYDAKNETEMGLRIEEKERARKLVFFFACVKDLELSIVDSAREEPQSFSCLQKKQEEEDEAR